MILYEKYFLKNENYIERENYSLRNSKGTLRKKLQNLSYKLIVYPLYLLFLVKILDAPFS